MLGASVFIAGSTLMARLATSPRLRDPLHPLQVSHGRFPFAWILIATTAAALRLKISRPNLPLNALRTLGGWSGVSLMRLMRLRAR